MYYNYRRRIIKVGGLCALERGVLTFCFCIKGAIFVRQAAYNSICESASNAMVAIKHIHKEIYFPSTPFTERALLRNQIIEDKIN